MRPFAIPAVLALILPCAIAHADTLSVFNIHGSSLFYGMGGDTNKITGTTTIDVTTGVVESIALTAGGLLESGVDTQHGTEILVGPASAKFTISGVSLIDFTGDNFNLNGPNDLYVGQVSYAGPADPAPTAPVAVAPEPATLTLLATGLLGVAAMTRRRVV